MQFLRPILLLCAGFLLLPAAGNDVFNGSFERSGRPDGWEWSTFGGGVAACAVIRSGGNRHLRIAYRSLQQPNRYGQLLQNVPLTPGRIYRLSWKMWGKPARNICWTLGKHWKLRPALPSVTPEAARHTLRFRAEPDEFDGKLYPVRLICENLTPELNLDDIEITEEELPAESAVTFVPPEKALSGKVFRLPRLDGFPRDGGFPGGVTVWTPADDADFSASFALGWNQDGLLLFFRVRDDVLRPVPGSAMYLGDSVQLRIDQDGELAPQARSSDLELGFQIDAAGKLATWNWNTNMPIPETLVESVVTSGENGFSAAVLLKDALFDRIDFRRPKPFSFNLIFNDRDGGDDRRVISFARGIHDSKSSADNVLLFPEGGAETARVCARYDDLREHLAGIFYTAGAAGDTADFVLRLTPEHGSPRTIPLCRATRVPPGTAGRLPFRRSVSELPEGRWTAEFLWNGRPAGKLAFERRALLVRQRKIWEEFRSRLSRIDAAYRRQFPERLPPSAALSLRVLNSDIPRLLSQMEAAESPAERRFYDRRGEMTAPEVAEALDELERELAEYRAGRTPPEYWFFRSGPVLLRGGFPYAELESSRGRRQLRPVLFAGYGHFTDVILDLPEFSGIGANLIQIEIGPSSIFPKEGKNGEFSEPDFSDLENRILPALRSAAEHNMKVCLLLSPHYHPAWLLDKYPDMRADSDFLKYEITHPKAEEMLDAYLAALIPKLKASPWSAALHSLVLSNEPVYIGCTPYNPQSLKDFRHYLKQKYRTPSDFNAAAQRDYPDFDSMTGQIETDPALRSEFERFRRDTFAAWHRRLAERVRRIWPEIPLHAKMMIFSSLYVPQATDAGMFAAFSDYNGNDNYRMYDFDNAGLAPHHISSELGSELQLSARKLSICNSENHIIADGETRPVPNGHIYTAMFEQYATGASALITWVWTDIDYLKSLSSSPMFCGNIRNRPGNIIAHGRAMLDANRVARELVRFSRYEPETAILHAPSSLLHAPERYKNSLDALYAATLPTGHRVRFLSEEQLGRREFGAVRLLLLPEAEYLDRKALAGLNEFVRRGGRVMVCGKAPRYDEFGNSLPEAPDFPKLPLSRLGAELDATTPLPFRLAVRDGAGGEGLYLRCVPDGDAYLINLVNYGKNARKLNFSGTGTFRDLLREETFEPEFELPPQKPLLLRFLPAGKP